MSNINKNTKIAISLLIASIVIISIHSLFKIPTNIDKSITGIIYKVGGNEFSNITVDINGKIKKTLFTDNTIFVGTIKFTGIEDLLEKNYSNEIYKELFNTEVKFRIHEGKFVENKECLFFTLDYYMMKDNIGYNEVLGTIYFEPEFNKLTIIKADISNIDENVKIISAPATTKEEALKITKSILDYSVIE